MMPCTRYHTFRVVIYTYSTKYFTVVLSGGRRWPLADGRSRTFVLSAANVPLSSVKVSSNRPVFTCTAHRYIYAVDVATKYLGGICEGEGIHRGSHSRVKLACSRTRMSVMPL